MVRKLYKYYYWCKDLSYYNSPEKEYGFPPDLEEKKGYDFKGNIDIIPTTYLLNTTSYDIMAGSPCHPYYKSNIKKII